MFFTKLKKVMCDKKLFCKIFEQYFQKIESSKIDLWQFGYDYFLTTSKPNNSDVS